MQHTRTTRVFLLDCTRPMQTQGSYVDRVDTHMPPLGLLMLASNLLQSDLAARTTLAIADVAVDFASLDDVARTLQDFAPDLVGLRCLSLHTETMKRCAEIANGLSSRPLIVAGGPYASSARQLAFDEVPALDMVAVGEGERTFCDIVSALHSSADPTDVPGTISKTQGGIKAGPPRAFVADLDQLAITDWRLIDFSKYKRFNTGFAPVLRPCATVMTTRGCPYRCVYCHEILGKQYRKRSVGHVLRELELLHGLGVRDVNIIDDSFNLDNPRAVKLFEEIAKRNWGMRFYFGNGVRGDRLPRDVVDAMVDGGTIYMVYALESANERIQRYIKKNLDLKKFDESIRYAIQKGIMVEMFTMVGFPTETEEEMRCTVDYATQLDGLCMIYLNVVNFFPGTKLFDMAIEAGTPRAALMSQDRSQGFMSGGFQPGSIDNVRLKLAWSLTQEDRLARVLKTQRKFLSEEEIQVLHRIWWGRGFRLSARAAS